MPLTEQERDDLVDELCDRLWDMPVLLDTTRPQRAMIAEEACLPIIERLLAANDLDALLDSVHPDAVTRSMYVDGDHCEADIGVPKYRDAGGPHTYRVFRGTGPKRMDALRDAVAKAKEAGNE